MQIAARVESRKDEHHVTLQTNGQAHTLTIPPKPNGSGSSANGGELLALALATCYCNDLYREAASRQISVRSVDVEVQATFGGPGEPASALSYRVRVEADAPGEAIAALIAQTDAVAEVHNTLRRGLPVTLLRD